jgi:hypothetical protein
MEQGCPWEGLTRWEERDHLEYLGVGGSVMKVDLCGNELMVVD